MRFGARVAFDLPSGFRACGNESGATDRDRFRREIMRTRSIPIEAVYGEFDGELLVERDPADRKQFARSRTARSPKRRTTRTVGASVPLGMSARRNRRFGW
jgi:hypothetical protein